MIIGDEGLKMPPQTLFVEHDQMIQAFAAYRSDQSFHIGPLPGRTRCRKQSLDAHRLCLLHEFPSEDAISIA